MRNIITFNNKFLLRTISISLFFFLCLIAGYGQTAPVVDDIPDETIDEDGIFATINLDDYVADDDDDDEDITWTVSGNTNLKVTIDANRVATIEVEANWNGTETITFTATDDEPLIPGSDSDDVTFIVNPVNDAPVVDEIPGETIDEDGSFATIDLDDYVNDVDIDDTDEDITWTFSGNTNLTVTIDANRVATIEAPADWNGTETITFTATDDEPITPGSDSDEVTFIVNAVNDAPVVDEIPGETIDEDGSFATIDLDDYVNDVDDTDENITWTFSGNTNLTVTIDANRVATIEAPADWSGTETITFTATDDEPITPGSDSDDVTFIVNPVNDAPVVDEIPGETIIEDGTFATINLDDFVADVDDADEDITWTVSGNTNLIVTIDANRVATIVADANWNGTETITFTATDDEPITPGSDNDDVVFTVTATNDVPIVGNIPGETIEEDGVFATINLDTYVEDVEDADEDITWTFSGNTELTVEIDLNRIATITSPPDWNGSEVVTFTAEDLDGGVGSDTAIFVANPVNDPPVSVNDSYSVAEGDTLIRGALVGVLVNDSDIENDPFTTILLVRGVEYGTLTINDDGSFEYIHDGSETLIDSFIYRVSDGVELGNQATARITITPVNDVPVGIDDEYTLDEGATRTWIVSQGVLANDLDPDGDELTAVLFSSPKHGTVQLELDGSFTYEHDGSMTTLDSFTYRPNDGTINGNLTIAKITIDPVNDPPYFQGFPQIDRSEGSDTTFTILSDYAMDEESSIQDLTFGIGIPRPSNFNSYINGDTLFIAPKDADWFGTENIYLTINDNDPTGAEITTDTILLNVLNVDDAPRFTVKSINVAASNEDEAVTSVYLDPSIYIDEIDGDDFTLELPVDPDFTFTNTNFLIQATVSENWNGERSFEFYVVDDTPQQLRDTIVLTYTINPVDDPPFVQNPIFDLTVLEEADSIIYDLQNVFEDIDNSEEEMNFSLLNTNENIVNTYINSDDQLILKLLEDKNTSGFYGGVPNINIGCTSNGKLVNNLFSLTVTPVNDPPTFVISGDVIIFGNDVQHQREVTVTADDVPVDECDLACTSYSLSPSSVSFANVSINELFGNVSITVPVGAEGYQEFTIIANDGQDIAMETFQLSVNVKADQTIVFNSIPDQSLSDSIVILKATASSGLPVSFEVIGGKASVSNDTLNILGDGQIVVRASQDGDGFYKPAPDVDRSFYVNKLSQVITFEELQDKYFGDDDFALRATSTSELEVYFEVEYGPVSIVNDTIVKINGSGDVKIIAKQDGDDDYAAADTVAREFEILKADQSIQFESLADQVYSPSPIQLSATSSSGLPVNFAVVSGAAYVHGNSLHVNGAGYITIRALQNGNNNFNPAEDVDQTIEIYKASQSISFSEINDTTYGSFDIALDVETTSGLPAEFLIEGPVEINDTSVSITGTGTVFISAFQPGDERYFSTDTITRSFVIEKAVQVIDLNEPEPIFYGIENIALTATATSGLELSFEIISGPAIAQGNVIEPYDYGEVIFRVVQNGNENYKSTSIEYSINFVKSVYDASLVKFISPSSWEEVVLHNPRTVKVRIKNIGNRDIEPFNIYYSVDYVNFGDIDVAEQFRNTLSVGDSADYSFSSIWSPRELNVDFCVYFKSTSDSNPLNDSICLPLFSSAIPHNYNKNLIESVYPNPADNFIYFSLGNNIKEGLLIIYNTSGAVVGEFKIVTNTNKVVYEVDVNNYRQGIYYYKFFQDNEFTTGKFVVK